MNEQLRVKLWCLYHYPIYKWKSWRTRHLKRRLHILNSEETVKRIIASRLSVCRYGDGELQMVSHHLQGGGTNNFAVDTFQHYDTLLGRRLYEIITSAPETLEGLLVCLPYQLKRPNISDLYGELFWEREWLSRLDIFAQCHSDQVFGDASFTRFYLGRKDITDYPAYIRLLQQIWAGRDLIIVEGALSRLGVGNDLFDSSRSIRRVICPSTNAFGKYADILEQVKQVAQPGDLLLLALGHTATVLAVDLHLLGYQAIDIGHIDIEYEWYRMGAKGKVAIPNKYVNEVASGRIQEASIRDQKYLTQIVARVD